MKTDVNELAIGMKTGDIKIIAVKKTEENIKVEDIVCYNEETSADTISSEMVTGFKKHFEANLPENKIPHIVTYLIHYLNKIPRLLFSKQ